MIGGRHSKQRQVLRYPRRENVVCSMDNLVNFFDEIVMLMFEHPGLKLEMIFLNVNETLYVTFVIK